MLDQNTDRMWFVIGAVIVGAAIIFIANGTLPELFANVTKSFDGVANEGQMAIDVEMVNMDSKIQIQDKEISNVTEGLMLYYDFSSGSGNSVADKSGHGKNATLHGFNHNANSGWSENGLLFDNVDDYVKGPSNLYFADDTITLHARVTFHELEHEQSIGRLGTILKKGHPDKVAAHTGFAFSYDNRAHRADFSYTAFGNPSGGFNGGGNSFNSKTSTYKLQNNTAYSLTVSVDETGLGRIYIDGMLYFNRQFSEDVDLNNSDELLVGVWATGSNYLQTSKTIENVRIYDRALDPVEILMIHTYDTRGE